MSDFKYFLHQQMKDPEFRRFWEARNELILQQTAGMMALSEMALTTEDEARILNILEHPEEFDTMLEKLIKKHTVNKQNLKV